MENATEALYIAVGTLIGVMIISLVVFFFRRVGSLQEQQDRIMTADQLAEWNNMYLAYNKKIMYGTDLISVLNKAQSNNEKYVNGKGFLTGYRYTNSYLIDIEFTLNSTLQDTVTFYYLKDTAKEFAYANGEGPNEDNSQQLIDLFSAYNISSYKDPNPINNMDNNLISQVKDSEFKAKDNNGADVIYRLLNDNYTLNEEVGKIMKLSNNMKMDVNNKGEHISMWTESSPSGTDIIHKGWSRATWVTCLSDLKSRKFECTGVEYDTSSEQTGRITKMTFKELDHK